MKTLAAALIASVVLAGSLAPADAQTRLRVSNWLPPSHPIVADMMRPWAEAVSDATEGRVEVEIMEAPLGPPQAQFDIVATGQADVGYGVHGYTPGRFVLTQVAELPFLGDSAEAVSVAYWRLHEEMLAEAGEHRGVKVLSVFAHGPGHVYTTGTEVDGIDDLQGLKLRTGGGIVNAIAKELGAVPLLEPSSKTYEILSAGIADGILFPHESVPFFRLDGIVRHGAIVPRGLYNTSFFVAMNEAVWDGLSPEDQEAVMSVSGEAFARRAGQAWDAADAAGREKMVAAGISFVTLSDDEVARIAEKLKPVEARVFGEMAEKGVDGEAALQALRDRVEAYGN
ncbi:TRAP transporter substrate-binding protein [Lutibaculum baratangense]|uniref:Putative extracellular solute-binding protein n=1 Tax=Lutibaculum baratangense AMV1 TaxID=631454 RepID=V4RJ45_9HYPH|nr:TRAP transporter substrate-binding protein [Lutibaculum baratangense]ESR25339.1 putative extracellular solute-binding protein [Lutibaculum baratangense AMV1]